MLYGKTSDVCKQHEVGKWENFSYETGGARKVLCNYEIYFKSKEDPKVYSIYVSHNEMHVKL